MYRVSLINDGEITEIQSSHFNGLKLIDPMINQGINVANTFKFTILPDNPGYELIRPYKTLVRVLNTQTNTLDFDGRILSLVENMTEDGSYGKSFICEDELGFLNDSCQRHGEYHDISVRDFLQIMINNHNADIAHDEIDKTFVLGEVTVDSSTGTLYRYLNYENTLDAIFDKLVDRLGGELRVRKVDGVRYLDYIVPQQIIQTTEIRIAKNLRSISKETDPTDIITRLIPLGSRIESEDEGATDASQARVTIADVNGGRDYIEDLAAQGIFSVLTKNVAWDDVNEPGILLSRGREYLRENNRVKVKYVISALDLSLIKLAPHSFEVGYYYPVINPVMNINENLRVIGKSINLNEPEQNSLVIGDQFLTASDYQNRANQSARKIFDLEETVGRQSQVITNIRKEVTNVESSLNDLQQAIENADLEGLEQVITNLTSAVDRLEDLVPDIEKIADLQQAVEVLTNIVQNHEQRINGNEQGIAVTSQLLSAYEASNNLEIQQIKARLDALDGGNE
ncbi:phage tail spike protein [Alkalihalobacillus trypoxylicola]|uniref:Tail spike domain-containing protein n=1 Tax=Alkalihalobacillus trypoxylicola TaxID=519424 RepID=A0A161P9G7_9BACI|nr:phage tail spike protein [Alkalihalobacillus trypoxylicola]KYG28184.1 hypothetical protein AZF04_09790 [Alkalihalobacillus trypoxylicola]